MLKFKYISLIFTVLNINFLYCQYTDVINSNRPGESMSAFSLGQTVFQAEMGLYGINENHDLLGSNATGFGSDMAFRYGILLEQLEFVGNLQFQNDRYTDFNDTLNRSGFKKILLGAKYLLYDPNKMLEEKNEIRSWKKLNRFSIKDMIPAVSVYAGTNINLSKSPFNSFLEPTLAPKLMVITQNQFPKSFVLVTNVFADRFLSEYLNYGYVVTITKGLNYYWSVFLENKAIQGQYYSDGIFTAGAANLFGQNMQVDVSVSKNYKTTPSLFYGGIGFSWRFDGNYKQILVRDRKKDREIEKLEKIEAKKQKKLDDAQYKIDKAQYKIDKAAYDLEMKTQKNAKKEAEKKSQTKTQTKTQNKKVKSKPKAAKENNVKTKKTK